jgi:hypothetical protein
MTWGDTLIGGNLRLVEGNIGLGLPGGKNNCLPRHPSSFSVGPSCALSIHQHSYL